jgi:HD-GYP domain-containing protein (c-di-GMP phosphodiesterase class II)
MPLLVPTNELTPGMKLAESLVVNGRVMLQADRHLTEKETSAVRRRFPKLRLRIIDPVLDSVCEFEDDKHERSVSTQVQQRVSECMAAVEERFSGQSSVRDVNVSAIQSTVVELMGYLRENPVSAALVNNCLDSATYLGTHTANVFYLSMLLGSKVLSYVMREQKRQTMARDLSNKVAGDLFPLGLGVMLMELGMFELQHLLEAKSPLTEEQSEKLRQHPQRAMALIPESVSPLARVVVRNHHENYAGTGYPNALSPDRLHVFARIARIADAFDAATSDQMYRQAKTPARVLWEMSTGPAARYYDPVLMSAFTNLIHPFPVGAKIRLRDGRFAVVIKYNRKNPMQPRVIVAFDSMGKPLPRFQLERPCSLGESGNMRAAWFRGEDLSFLYTTTSPEELYVPSRFNHPFEAAYP